MWILLLTSFFFMLYTDCVTDNVDFVDNEVLFRLDPNPKYGEWDLEAGVITVGAYDNYLDECDSDECKEYQVCGKENGVDCDEGLAYVVRHPNYNPEKTGDDYDFALIFLPTAAPDGIVPISINSDANVPANDEALVVAGWGYTNEVPIKIPDVPNKVTVQYVPNNVCNNIYRDTTFDVTDNELCAVGAQGKGTCFGDSGK